MITSRKPIVFVSSTIHDFKDLRSAIKYYLEELGYEVLLSEYNDFPKQLEQNVLEACLTTIEHADYFILIIGSRIGGYYDARKKISITRVEYRKAYELAKAGKLRIIILVRDELWKVKTDRAALASYLETDYASQNEIRSNVRRKIANHPSPLLNDPETIFSFIDEVSHASEMQAAIDGQAPFPIANWVHRFTTFRDIADIFKTHLDISESLSTIAMKVNLQRELLNNLIALTEKYNRQITPFYSRASFTRKHITGNMDDSIQIPSKYLNALQIFSLFAFSGTLSTQFIDKALESGQFLQYNKNDVTFDPTLLSERLFLLKERIDNLRRIGPEFKQSLFEFIAKYKDIAKAEGNVTIPNRDLYIPLAIADRQEDVVVLSVAIFKYLEGDASFLHLVKLNPPSPLVTISERKEEETITLDDIKAWITGFQLPR